MKSLELGGSLKRLPHYWPGAFSWKLLLQPGPFFLLFASVLGFIMLVVMPPFMVPDENAHLYRAYQVSTGHIFSTTVHGYTGGYMPNALVDDTDKVTGGVLGQNSSKHVYYRHFLATKIHSNPAEFTRFDGTAIYSPFSYIPQAVGILITRIVYPSELTYLYIGRLFNLAAYIALVYLAIRLLPIGKWVVVALALLPMALHQAASLSSDVTNIGLLLIAAAYSIRLYVQQVRLTRGHYIKIFVLGVLLGLTKQSNVVFIIPFLFLPTAMFGSLKRRLIFIASFVAISVGSLAVWYGATKLLHYDFTYSGNALVDTPAQIKYVLHHPVGFVKTLVRTFIYNPTTIAPSADFNWVSAVGVFSWIKYQLPLISILAAYGSLLLALLYRPVLVPKKLTVTFSSWQRVVYAGTFVASLVAIGAILYFVWTPVGAPVIAGIQGRYFTPLFVLLIPVFYSNDFRLVAKRDTGVVAAISAAIIFNFVMMAYLTVSYFSMV